MVLGAPVIRSTGPTETGTVVFAKVATEAGEIAQPAEASRTHKVIRTKAGPRSGVAVLADLDRFHGIPGSLAAETTPEDSGALVGRVRNRPAPLRT